MDDPKERQRVLDALADYQGKGDILDQQEALQKALKAESHRGLVIILQSYIEDALLDRLIREIPNGKDNRRALSRGPLKSVESRIAMGKALGILTEREAIVVDVFKAMRNACAHSRLEISFATPELANALTLVLHDGKTFVDELEPDVRMGAFITCATYMISVLKGRSHKETYDRMARLNEELGADGQLETGELLLATLREIQRDTQSPDSPQETTDRVQ